MVEVSIWVVVGEDGDFECGTNGDQAEERYDEEIGGSAMRRMVKVNLKVPFPIPVVEATVPAEGNVVG